MRHHAQPFGSAGLFLSAMTSAQGPRGDACPQLGFPSVSDNRLLYGGRDLEGLLQEAEGDG